MEMGAYRMNRIAILSDHPLIRFTLRFTFRYSCARVASILQKERNVIWDFRVGVVRLKGSCKTFA